MLFHQALHGDYGYQDPELERHFGQTTDPGITYYINAAGRGLRLRYANVSRKPFTVKYSFVVTLIDRVAAKH